MGIKAEKRPVRFVAGQENDDPVVLPTHTVANAPDPTLFSGAVIFVSNGAAGSPVLAVSDGTNWIRSDTLATIAAS